MSCCCLVLIGSFVLNSQLVKIKNSFSNTLERLYWTKRCRKSYHYLPDNCCIVDLKFFFRYFGSYLEF